MILIDEIVNNDINYRFYNGMDFDILIDHSKNGSDGFIICFIENWVSEMKAYNRNKKIFSILDSIELKKFEWNEINNNYVIIYQIDCDIDINIFYKIIKDKVLRNQPMDLPYLSIDGIDKGVWKINP